MSEVLLDRAGRRRSPATLPGFHAGQALVGTALANTKRIQRPATGCGYGHLPVGSVPGSAQTPVCPRFRTGRRWEAGAQSSPVPF
jgi:hypothetical protein